MSAGQPSPEAVLSVSPVSDADGRVHGKESQELFVQHLVDAAFPGQQQLGEATETGVGNSGCVGDSHWWQADCRSSVKEPREGNKHLGDVSPAGGTNVPMSQVYPKHLSNSTAHFKLLLIHRKGSFTLPLSNETKQTLIISNVFFFIDIYIYIYQRISPYLL